MKEFFKIIGVVGEFVLNFVAIYNAVTLYSENIEKAIFWAIVAGFSAMYCQIKYYGIKLAEKE